MSGARAVWTDLAPPWRAAFDEAWASWLAGNFGIGAVLVDPTDGAILARGRNRVTEMSPGERQLGGNMLAHAEMNAFARMETFLAVGLHLYTTLEPCLMCAATAMQLRVEHVHLAAEDEFYDGLHEVWAAHPVTERRTPERTGPFAAGEARLGAFARLLPLTYTSDIDPPSTAWTLALEHRPELAGLAADPVVRERLRGCATVTDALVEIWDELPA